MIKLSTICLSLFPLLFFMGCGNPTLQKRSNYIGCDAFQAFPAQDLSSSCGPGGCPIVSNNSDTYSNSCSTGSCPLVSNSNGPSSGCSTGGCSTGGCSAGGCSPSRSVGSGSEGSNVGQACAAGKTTYVE